MNIKEKCLASMDEIAASLELAPHRESRAGRHSSPRDRFAVKPTSCNQSSSIFYKDATNGEI